MSQSSAVVLSAEKRAGHGKGAARALRRIEQVPAIIYSKSSQPVNIALPYNELFLQYKKGRFNSRVVELSIGGEKVRALPQDVQLHPVTDKIEHVDFIRVEKNVPLRVRVPVKFLNQERCVGIKRGGVLNIVRHDIEFMCSPDAIPDQIEIDTLELNIGDSVHIKDVTLPAGITPTIKRNFTVATIAGRSSSDDEATAAPAATAAAAPAAAAPAKDKK